MDYWVYAWAKPISAGLLAGGMICQALVIVGLVLVYIYCVREDGVE